MRRRSCERYVVVRLLRGDCRVTLPTLEAGSVQACITSVPYFQLRSYLADDDPLKSYEIGLESRPELWLVHLSHVFDQVKRVLRDDGTLWVNCGDSYAGSGNGSNDHRQNGKHYRKGADAISLNADKYKGQRPGTVEGLVAKNLMMMPSRLAMALQSDGWILRSMIPWLKRAAMPESVTDRPSSAVEYIFLFSKSRTYYWDADAVRTGVSENTHSRGTGIGKKQALIPMGTGNRANENFGSAINGPVSSRNRRNTDWFFESWQGLMLGDDDTPLAMIVNPTGYSGAHFATFPPKLVEPMVKASTRPGDVVLDPFSGAGTTLMVADRLGRNAIGCELSDSYADLGTDRVVGDAPMFVSVEGADGTVAESQPIQDKQAALGKRTYTGFNARWDAQEAAAKQPTPISDNGPLFVDLESA